MFLKLDSPHEGLNIDYKISEFSYNYMVPSRGMGTTGTWQIAHTHQANVKEATTHIH